MPITLGHGVVTIASSNSVANTTAHLIDELTLSGMTIFAQIDQQAAASSTGLIMPPMMLLLFGNPKGGTPLMLAFPTLAIDLPLKALVWEDGKGKVWVSTNNPEYLRQRHELKEVPFAGIPALLERAIQKT